MAVLIWFQKHGTIHVTRRTAATELDDSACVCEIDTLFVTLCEIGIKTSIVRRKDFIDAYAIDALHALKYIKLIIQHREYMIIPDAATQ